MAGPRTRGGEGKADAEVVSSAPPAPSPAGPQDSRRTRGTLTQQESGASPQGKAGRLLGLGSGHRFQEVQLSEGSGPVTVTSGAGGKAGVGGQLVSGLG